MLNPSLWKIVVVDDSPDVVETTAFLLEMQGFSVAAFSDSLAASVHLRSHEADLVLLDIEMPGPNGFELARALRADPATADIVIVFHSGLHPAVVAARFSGHDALLTKPLNGSELMEAVELLITERAQTLEGRAKVAEAQGHWLSLYTSRMTAGQAPDMPEEILRLARLRNDRTGLTGALVFDGVRFAQLIEGPRDRIEALQARLRRDSRHDHLQQLVHGKAAGARRFDGIPMGLHRATGDDRRVHALADLRDEDALMAFDALLPPSSAIAHALTRPRVVAHLVA